MDIKYKGIKLSVETLDFKEEKATALIYYKGNDVTELFEKLDHLDEINNQINQ